MRLAKETPLVHGEPVRVVISRFNIKMMSFELPNKKQIKLSAKNPAYTTSDPDEIDFFSKQKGVSIIRLTDQEFGSWMRKNAGHEEVVQNRHITIDDVIDDKWTTKEEESVAKKLRKLGYTVRKRDTTIRKELKEEAKGDTK
jgi:hypothetical protein